MRLAILCAVRENWDGVPALLGELRLALAHWTEFETSVWLIDDAAESRPSSWHSLEAGGLGELHVVELQGRQGRNRAFAAALGYLLFEREESCDACLLLDLQCPEDARRLEPLFEAALRHPDSVVLAPGGPESRGPLAGLGHGARRAVLRVLSGERLGQSPALILPARAAEALCHSPQGASHVESALRRLRFRTVTAVMPRVACGIDLVAAASVYRDPIFTRTYRAAALLSALALLATLAALALRAGGWSSLTTISWAGPALLAGAFANLALLCLLSGVFSHSLSETRRWTPSLDAPLLVRSVTRVKRQPYAVALGTEAFS